MYLPPSGGPSPPLFMEWTRFRKSDEASPLSPLNPLLNPMLIPILNPVLNPMLNLMRNNSNPLARRYKKYEQYCIHNSPLTACPGSGILCSMVEHILNCSTVQTNNRTTECLTQERTGA
jgi:hypothetical protein